MTLVVRLKKRLIHTGIIPLAVLLTGCPEKLPEDFSIENIQKIRQMKCEIIDVPAEPYKIDANKLISDPQLSPGWGITFKAWYGFDTTKEPDYKYTYPKRKAKKKAAYGLCDAFMEYIKKTQSNENKGNNQDLTSKITLGAEF